MQQKKNKIKAKIMIVMVKQRLHLQ